MPDPLTVGAIAAPILGGLFSSRGQAKANRMNLRIAREQMAFQEKQRATEWQTAVQDMTAAGINPALALQHGGAGAMSGQTATMMNESEAVGEGLSRSLSSAMQVRQLKAATKEAEARARGAKASADYQDAYNKAHGISFKKDGSLQLDLTNPGIAQKVQAEISSARALARLNEMKIPEGEALAKMWESIDSSGMKSMDDFINLIGPLLLRRAAGR